MMLNQFFEADSNLCSVALTANFTSRPLGLGYKGWFSDSSDVMDVPS